ncbi:MAG: hypothetical protein EBU33_05945 [Sphingobacteriia bacterium]|nr:hypothetical protein [Sphingobacteriia bacterium]
MFLNFFSFCLECQRYPASLFFLTGPVLSYLLSKTPVLWAFYNYHRLANSYPCKKKQANSALMDFLSIFMLYKTWNITHS